MKYIVHDASAACVCLCSLPSLFALYFVGDECYNVIRSEHRLFLTLFIVFLLCNCQVYFDINVI